MTSSGSSFHRRRLRDACNPWNLVSVACTAGSRETLECNSTRYVAHASYNEIAIEGLWKKLEETRELLEKIKNKFIVSDRMSLYHSNESTAFETGLTSHVAEKGRACRQTSTTSDKWLEGCEEACSGFANTDPRNQTKHVSWPWNINRYYRLQHICFEDMKTLHHQDSHRFRV